MLPAFLLLHAFSCRVEPPATDSAGDTNTDTLSADLFGYVGPAGALLWTDEAGEWLLEVSTDQATWQTVADGAGPWGLVEVPEGAAFRLQDASGGTSAPFTPVAVTASLRFGRGVLGLGEPVPGQLSITLGDGTSTNVPDEVSVELSRDSVQTEREWLDGACLDSGAEPESCWSTEAAVLTDWTLPPLVAADIEPTRWTLNTTVSAERDGVLAVLDGAQASYISTGRSLAFGDTHAHTNLSHDGCETLDETCSNRGKAAAEGFFNEAVDQGLDFTAITDHAEFETLESTEGDTTEIWLAQQDAVLQADGLQIVPLIGYEWTSASGHRTVLFEEETPCSALRIPAWPKPHEVVRLDVADVFSPNPLDPLVLPASLWDALAEAGVACKSTGRVLTIPHHPAAQTPEPVIWTEEHNTPDLYYERLVEIASEHGTSECIDLKQEHCDWRLKVDIPYETDGSVQAALQQGYRLGFIGGTDSHDNMPGSLDDGPSCIASIVDGAFRCHDYPGALTGVYYANQLGRQTLFDGLFARNTLATTGPRPLVQVALAAPNGEVSLPGDDIPSTDKQDFQLSLDLPGVTEEEILGIDLLDAGGSILETWTSPGVLATIPAEPGDILYIRIRLDVDGTEERMWISPFFFGL